MPGAVTNYRINVKLIKNYGNDGKHRYIGTDTTGLSVSKDGFYFEEIETVFDIGSIFLDLERFAHE